MEDGIADPCEYWDRQTKSFGGGLARLYHQIEYEFNGSTDYLHHCSRR